MKKSAIIFGEKRMESDMEKTIAKEPIKLSDHFTYKRILRFVMPPIAMMIFTSIYSVVDGFFVSSFVGKTEFAALNLIMPLLIVLGAVGFMLGTGGTAIVAKTFGLGDAKRANEYFSLIIYVNIVTGIVLATAGILLARPVAILLGATSAMLEHCVLYARIILVALPFFMLQNTFQSFFVTAEKPKMGLLVTVLAGITNMVLDALFVGLLGWGLAGAAVATALAQFVGGAIPLFYFARKNSSTLRLTKTKFYGKMLLKTCTNGSSELMSNISMSVVTMLYNFQLMNLKGEDGVAAYGAIMYIGFFCVSIFIGYAIGSAPVVGFNYGAGNKTELRSLFRKSAVLMAVMGASMCVLSFIISSPFSLIFSSGSKDLYELTRRGFMIFALHYLIAGFNIFGSSFFTALNNGLISAIISFLRTIVFQCGTVLILPTLMGGVDGVWWSVVIAEALTFIVTLALIIAFSGKYGYAGRNNQQ